VVIVEIGINYFTFTVDEDVSEAEKNREWYQPCRPYKPGFNPAFGNCWWMYNYFEVKAVEKSKDDINNKY
jgi:hypothetical protein